MEHVILLALATAVFLLAGCGALRSRARRRALERAGAEAGLAVERVEHSSELLDRVLADQEVARAAGADSNRRPSQAVDS